ncbi:MAG TPA: HNH endonuclease [Pyrinomonadaceae bacterium]|nr:HNH endonuclease [Pyrinomonadaceae bacterium]
MPLFHKKAIPKLTLTEQNRFWHKVDMSGGQDVCWLWTGYVRESGYGVCCFRAVEYKAHRIAFFLSNGLLRTDMLVLHSCDNRRCCNPQHLRQGTPRQNSQDSVKRGRNTRLRGERNGKAKLTRGRVDSIRKMLRNVAAGRLKMYQYQIAEQHGVSAATVSYLKNGGRWDHVPLD